MAIECLAPSQMKIWIVGKLCGIRYKIKKKDETSFCHLADYGLITRIIQIKALDPCFQTLFPHVLCKWISGPNLCHTFATWWHLCPAHCKTRHMPHSASLVCEPVSVGEIDHPGHSCAGVSNEAGFPRRLIEAPINSHASGYSLCLCCGMEMRSDRSMYNLLSHQSDIY